MYTWILSIRQHDHGFSTPPMNRFSRSKRDEVRKRSCADGVLHAPNGERPLQGARPLALKRLVELLRRERRARSGPVRATAQAKRATGTCSGRGGTGVCSMAAK